MAYCPVCGAKMKKKDLFCRVCGVGRDGEPSAGDPGREPVSGAERKRARRGLWAAALAALLLLAAVCVLLWGVLPDQDRADAAGPDSSLGDQLSFLVQGNLDALYLGVFDGDYQALTGQSEEQCQAAYEAGMEDEMIFFASYMEIGRLSQQQQERLTGDLKELYARARYLVTDWTETEDGYAVRLKISPLDTIHRLTEQVENGAMDWFFEAYSGDISGMSEEEYGLYDAEWTDGLLALLESELEKESAGYLEPVYFEAHVKEGEQGLWTVDSADMDSIDYLILPYPQ